MTMRTLHLINGLGTGGAERSLGELLPDLRQYDIEPQVAVFHRRAEGVEDDVRAAGITVHHIGAPGWLGRIQAVRHLLAAERTDLLHTTIFEADIVGRVAAWREQVPVLTSLVNTSYDPIRLTDPNVSRPRLRAAQALDAATTHLGTVRFHAITGVVRDTAVRDLRVPPSDVRVIPRGRKRERLGEASSARRKAVRCRLGISDESSVVLQVGRHEYQKGHLVLLDAIAPLLDADRGLHLVLAGRQGSSTPAIDARIRSLGTDRIHVLGHVNDVPDLVCAADVFAFPSFYEGLGGAVLEAMALGTPIVASDIAPLREVLGPAATFFRAGDVQALSSAITAVLRDPHVAARRSQIGRDRFALRFEHGPVAAAMAELLAASATRKK